MNRETIYFIDGDPYRRIEKKKDGRIILAPLTEDEYIRANPQVYTRIIRAAEDIKAGLGQPHKLIQE